MDYLKNNNYYYYELNKLLTDFILFCLNILVAMIDNEEPYPSLSDYHDYEPNLEFDDTELQSPTADIGKLGLFTHRPYTNRMSIQERFGWVVWFHVTSLQWHH